MKIALCFAGLPKFFDKAYEYYKRNLLDHYSVDVFFHTWDSSDYNSVIDLYKPISYDVTPVLPKDIINKKYTRCADAINFPAFNTVSQFYSIYKSCFLKTDHEIRNGFKYDWVIKTRFDYALNVRFQLSNGDNSKLYVPHCRMTHARDFCNDQFAVSSSDNMNKYMSTYLHMDFYYDSGTIMNAEDMLSANLKYHKLVGENLVYVDMNNPFPPGPKNSTTHSLIRE